MQRLGEAGIASILVGIGTVLADNPSLTTRLEDGNGLDPTRIILDSRLSIPEDAKVLNVASNAGALIATGESASAEKARRLEQKGARVLRIPQFPDGGIDLGALMQRLGEAGIASILVEGGSRVMASALKAGIADKIMFFYAPKILGGDDGFPICRGEAPSLMRDCTPVRDVAVHRFGDDVMIEGYLAGGRKTGDSDGT
jgi:diaminohydroxyphosphoribosylaminopyrimidine deaminase/5-amino-6-(5-phosphoribosylamino)uracil reductase